MTTTSGLPRSVRPRPHHPVLRRSADAVQFGLLIEGAVEAAGLTPPLRRMLLEMRDGLALEGLLDYADRLGADPDDARALIADLYAAGALLDAGGHGRLVEARRSACVLLSGGGPLLAEVATGLAAAGVGTLRVVEATDDARAVVDAVRRVAPGVRTGIGLPHRRAELAVFAGPLRPDPELHRVLAGRRVRQLVVRVTDGVGLVGPLVLPGRSACLHCGDLHRAARDPCWATVAADLAGRVGSASRATATATAALAVEQALLVLDSLVTVGRPPPTLGAVLELDARAGELHRRPWPAHPDCECGAARTWPGEPSAAVPASDEPAGQARTVPAQRQVPCEEVVRR